MKQELRQLFIPRVSNWRTLTRGTYAKIVRLLLTLRYAQKHQTLMNAISITYTLV